MSKKAIFIFMLAAAVIIIIFLAVASYLAIEKRPQPSTDINELFLTMSEPMKDFVSARLSFLKCEPKQYYDKDSEICFVCGRELVCFGYRWSDEETKSGSKEIAQPSPYLTEVDGLTVEIGDFCYQGLASALGCQPVNNNSLDCGEVNITADLQKDALECRDVNMILKEGADFKSFGRRFCSARGYGVPENVEDMFPGVTESTPIEEIRSMVKEKFPDFSTENITKETLERFKESLEILFCGDYGLGLFKDTGQITVIKQ